MALVPELGIPATPAAVPQVTKSRLARSLRNMDTWALNKGNVVLLPCEIPAAMMAPLHMRRRVLSPGLQGRPGGGLPATLPVDDGALFADGQPG